MKLNLLHCWMPCAQRVRELCPLQILIRLDRLPRPRRRRMTLGLIFRVVFCPLHSLLFLMHLIRVDNTIFTMAISHVTDRARRIRL